MQIDEAKALEQFTEYFVRNYPGPDTIIHDPRWHAPKIFRAAKAALSAALAVPASPAGTEPEVGMQWRAIEDGKPRTLWQYPGNGDMAGWQALAMRSPDKYQIETRLLYASPPPPAPAVVVKAEGQPPFEFDRYINGTLMADGVTINLQTDVHEAMRAAARIASRGNNGEVPVLVLRSALVDAPAAPRALADGPIPGLSAWEGWDRSRGDWSETKHKDEVCEALFRAPWSVEDAAALLGFINRTWTRRPSDAGRAVLTKGDGR